MLALSKTCHYVALFQESVNTPLNGRPSLFRIDNVHQMETSFPFLFFFFLFFFPTLCWSINTL
jgi:hypothetical protein